MYRSNEDIHCRFSHAEYDGDPTQNVAILSAAQKPSAQASLFSADDLGTGCMAKKTVRVWELEKSLSSVNQLFLWAIFNIYVKLPEGIRHYT